MDWPYHEMSNEDTERVLRPKPHRPFELSSSPTSLPGTPAEPTFRNSPRSKDTSIDEGGIPSRTRSILNLTSSTLFGIYSTTGYAMDRDEPATPWGTSSQSPTENRNGLLDYSRPTIPLTIPQKGPRNGMRRRRSTVTQRHYHKPRKGFKNYYFPLFGRVTALFGVGVLYGVLISHLHDHQDLAPVRVDGIDGAAWWYLTFWGLTGVAIGQALPWVDRLWSAPADAEFEDDEEEQHQHNNQRRWNGVVRSIGAFVGIAFAIRKLPWQSTLQLSLTLALSNPAIWYLLDRTPPGFLLSSVISLTGTAVLLGINPELIPSPSPQQVLQGHVLRHHSANLTKSSLLSEEMVVGLFSQESVGVATWIASVLFVSCICFGNIGRRLAPSKR